MARTLSELSKFIVTHQTKILAVCAVASPVDVPAVSAALTAIVTFAALFERIHAIIDPNAPPSE
jgi:hypothetical protein